MLFSIVAAPIDIPNSMHKVSLLFMFSSIFVNS